jgi:hypothetical protein
VFGQHLHGTVIAGEDNRLFTLVENPFDQVDRQRGFRNGNLLPCLGQFREQPNAVFSGCGAVFLPVSDLPSMVANRPTPAIQVSP